MRAPILMLAALLSFTASSAAAVTTSGALRAFATEDRLALANRYLAVSHSEARYRRLIERALIEDVSLCHEPDCQRDLAKAIHAISGDVATQHVHDLAELYARRFSADQLRALIRFDSSLEGQSILETREGMAPEVDELTRRSVQLQIQALRLRFCPSHRENCESGPLPKGTPGSDRSVD